MTYTTAILLGLFSGFHCLGMCGPLAIAVHKGLGGGWIRPIVYHAGRITTYVLLGLVAGTIGKSLVLVGLQQWLSVFSGILMIAFALLYVWKGETFLSALIGPLASGIFRKVGKQTSSGFGKAYVLGFSNGLLPCGMVYMAMSGAMAFGNLSESAIYMALFGLGTFPLLWVASVAGPKFMQQTRGKLTRLIPYFVMAMGVLFILRGMNLGIPYVSPKLNAGGTYQAECHE